MKNQMEQPKRTEEEIQKAIEMAEARNAQREKSDKETQAKLNEVMKALKKAEEEEKKRTSATQPTAAPAAPQPTEPEKEIIRIPLPPKPTSSPTIKLPKYPTQAAPERSAAAPVASKPPNPKKETVKIDLPPKPTSSPTIKLPSLSPSAPAPEKPTTAPVATQKTEVPSPAPTEPAEKLPEFNYVAMDAKGKETKGTMSAHDQVEAIQRLKEMNLFPTKVTEKGEKKGTKEGPQSKTKKFATKEERAFEIARLEQVIKKAEARIEQNREIEKELLRRLRELDEKELGSKLLQTLELELDETPKWRFLKRGKLEKQMFELRQEQDKQRNPSETLQTNKAEDKEKISKRLGEVQAEIQKDQKISEDARKEIADIKGPFLSRRTIQIGLVTLLGIGGSTLGVMKVRDAHQNKTAREKMEKYLSEVDATNQAKGAAEKIYQATNENWLTNLQASTIGLTNEVKPTNTVELAPKVTPSPEPAPKVATVETNAINPPPILTVVTNATPSPKSIDEAKIRAELEKKYSNRLAQTQSAFNNLSNELATIEQTEKETRERLATMGTTFSNQIAKLEAKNTPTVAPKSLEETLAGIRVKITNKERLTPDEKAVLRKDLRKKIVTRERLTPIETKWLVTEIGEQTMGGKRLTREEEPDAMWYNNWLMNPHNFTVGSEAPSQKDTAPTPPQHKQIKDK